MSAAALHEASPPAASPPPESRPRRALLDPDALDFAPDLLAIQERPPSRLPRAVVITVGVLIGILLLWSMLAKLDIIASAEGKLVPLTFTKVVQPAEAGVVSDILVREGDVVKQGQLLIRLDQRAAAADVHALDKDVALKRLTLRRIDAELSDGAFLPVRGDAPELFAQAQAQFHAHRQAYLDALAEETEGGNKARAELLSAQQVLAKLQRTLPTYQRSADAYAQLVKSGFVGELAAAEKSRDAIEKEQDLRAQSATVTSLESAIAASDRKIAGLRSQYRSQLEGDRIDTLTQLNRSEQELQKSGVKASEMEIRAPNDGVVKDLATTNRGAVVSAGALLMNIVPREDPLEAEVMLKNEDVGFVAIGQEVRLKVAAYPFQKYGLIEGKVALVSADSSENRQAGGASPGSSPTAAAQAGLTYRALVHFDARDLQSASTGEHLTLAPGMLVTAEIVQGRRTVLEYLLSPVQKVGQEAGRER